MENKTKIVKNLIWVMKQILLYDKKYILVISCTMIIMGGIPPISTLISQSIINGVQMHKGMRTVVFFVVLYVGIDLIKGVWGYLLAYYKTKFSLGFSLEFKENLLSKASRLNLKDYEESQTYDLLNRAQYEGNGNIVSYFESFMSIFSSMITMISYLFILFSFNPYIVLCIIIIPIIKFLISKRINIMSFQLIKNRTNDSRKCWYIQYLITYGDFFKELKIYNLFDYFINKYKAYQNTFNKDDINLARKSSILMAGITLAELIIDGILFSYIVFCGYAGKILIGNVLTYMNTITHVKEQMTNILQIISGMNKDSLFIDQLINFYELPEECRGKLSIERIQNIKIVNLYYRHKEGLNYVLKNINLEIKNGETIALVGQNGSGKTTLIKILMGFYWDYEGEIFIDGINLRDIDKKSYMERVATLFQDFVKYESTFRENIAFGNLSFIDNDEKLYEISKQLGIDSLIQESEKKLDCQIGCWFDDGHQISIGQWQKVALCRAFIKNADFYLLDEPNSALDAISEYELSVLYNKILRNKIGIIVAHKFNNIIKRVDRVILMENGVISGSGSHEILLKTNDAYARLYDIQSGNI